MLEEAAYRTRRELTLWREYAQRDGTPVYRVYAVTTAEPLAALPEHGIVQAASFGDEIALMGHDPLEQPWQTGARVRFHVYWRAQASPQGGYKVFVHLAGADERVVAQHDGVPMLWAYPTSAWKPGEIVADRIVLDIPEDLPPGEYRLWIGMYDEADGVRLPAVKSGNRLPDDRLLLAEVVVTQ